MNVNAVDNGMSFKQKFSLKSQEGSFDDISVLKRALASAGHQIIKVNEVRVNDEYMYSVTTNSDAKILSEKIGSIDNKSENALEEFAMKTRSVVKDFIKDVIPVTEEQMDILRKIFYRK